MDEQERLEAVEIHPGPVRGRVEIRVRGALAEIWNLARRRPGEPLRSTALVERVKGIEPSS
jgi:hypothetical protein